MRQRALFACLVVWLSIGCSHFDTTRVPAARGTLGEEIVRVFCERMASEANPTDVMGLRWKPVCRGEVQPPGDAPRQLVVLMENRERLARALDQVLPEDAIGDDLGFFLGELLPLYDAPEERLPRNTRLLAELLETLRDDREAMEALARIGTREGYRPLRLALGVVRPVLAYEDFDEFANLALRVVSDDPADPADGLAAGEWQEMQRALALEMATLEPPDPVPAGEQTDLEIARELMFTQQDAFGSGTSRWLLIRDARGLALPASGTVVAPFVDMDTDGLADVDVMGRFVDATGSAMADLPRPFRVMGETGIARDPGGRALRSDGSRYFEYLDVDRTLLAAMVRDAGPLFDATTPTALQLSRGVRAILGPEMTLTETYGTETLTYEGPDTSRGSMFDMVYALSEMMHRDTTDRALALVETLMRDHEPETAALVMAADYMLDRSDMHGEAVLEQPNVLWDGLIQIGIEYAQEPGLMEAMIRSFADPRSAQLGEVYGGLMRHRDRITYDPSDPNGDPIGMPLDQRVDRSMPDTQDNESLFQRTIALIDGLNGVQVCNRAGAKLNMTLHIGPISLPLSYPLIGTADECELIRIDNVAEAYALSILGDYELELQDGFLNFMVDAADFLGINVDDALEESSGIEGLTRRPTPEAMARLVFWGLSNETGTESCTPAADGGDCNSTFAGQLFAPVLDRHGNDVVATYHGTIFAWEQPGFFEGMTPMLEVLHRPEFRYSDAGEYRFGQLITALHRHWASREHWLTQRTNPTGANFSFQDGGMRYEELVADGFVEGRLLERLQRAAAVTDAVEVEPGRDGLRVLAEASMDLIDPARNAGLATRDGRTTIPTNDGAREFAVTPLLLVLDGLRNMDRDLDASPDRRDPWRTARDRLATQFLGTRPLGDQATFTNRRGRAILLTILPFLRERLAEHRAAGDLVEWSRDLVPDTEEMMRSPLVWSGVRFLDRVQDDAEARDALSRLIGYLVNEASTNDAFAATLYAGADLLQVLEDDETILPLVHALSQALAPDALDYVAGMDDDGVLDIEHSVANDGLGLIRSVQARDTRRTLRQILANLVQLTDPDDGRTPLEEILDVIGEINRATPGAGGTFDAEDYEATFDATRGFMTDEVRGLERLFDVVQARDIR
ncbi:hypothetical protein [Sandaracinus amylolyticus]|uniref:hypothetical protein n=1 Tax=Sandaracinus amylolyticus TaxID=927083 RepID=UPI0012EE1400|nr:hypothetical protein [Sandaracinus amylolyticus]